MPEDFRTVDAIVEIPRGSRNKYEFDPVTGMIHLDRVLFSSVHYPGDYGFIPGTSNHDGDPLDVFREPLTCSRNRERCWRQAGWPRTGSRLIWLTLARSALLPVALDERGIDLAGDEGGVIEDFAENRDGGVDALDAELRQSTAHGCERLVACWAVDEKLGDE